MDRFCMAGTIAMILLASTGDSEKSELSLALSSLFDNCDIDLEGGRVCDL